MSASGLSCNEVVEIVTDYLEGVMSAKDRARFEEHLSRCDGCTNYLQQVRETIRLTGMLTEDQIPESRSSVCWRHSAIGRRPDS